ncbi:polysaccharide biosynthesis/export family protein [Burkholderia multivorans]|uniref:polysaccharide biosynthesis/export family protein n=1 Tax=Burkholderia multivorans TaxID=87883 RepID=UPI002B240770|nr:polysaccharide biosynthesis/export family protein [Burkholderia multivorans]MEB2486956.1 polysaccharide biosynthesis/export family protein [Burkholderia multivorans]MEB2569504.1 polysaccharide biosynthesis/export family protein [Burkholderia multivorans]
MSVARKLDLSGSFGMKCTRSIFCLTIVASFSMLSGCGVLSGAGPQLVSVKSDGRAQDPNAAYELIDLSAANIGPYMKSVDSALSKNVARPSEPEVRLMPGDVLKVVISDDGGMDKTVFAPLAQGGTVFQQVRVDAQGRISLPYMGVEMVRGATLAQVENIIRRGVKGRASEPQVHVELVSNLSSSVLVAGAVKNPGRFSVLQGPLTILDAINQAGGPVLEPYLINVVLRTGKVVQSYNYQDLLSGGNAPVPPNSEIVLERARKRFVAMGAVNQPGLHDFPSSAPSLLEVLGSVGGLNERTANPSGVFVFRLVNEQGADKVKAEVFRLDMREPVSMFLAKNFLIQPDDTVYVTNAPVYEMQKIISPIVQVLVLGRDISQ